MNTQTMLGMIGLGAGELLLISLSLALTAFWIWMLVDCAKRISGGEGRQIGWLIVIALTSVFGALIYFFFGRRSATATQS
jgi:hypothetical protein